MNTAAVRGHLREVGRNGLGAPILLLLMLAMMVLPLPAALLDLLFTFNISLALVVLLAGVYARRPLDFSSFPTILLLATLMRLALNVASTRVVLLEGHTGSDAAGKVIQAFGEFVIGGNYAVGLVVFFILVLINFVVVTKGATRISEVSARFTLDAMPGKQMAIDADLNAGLIDQEEARLRREEVVQEADFYGSMDGAGKFVRGDAIAGILILLINVVGGLAVGLLQHDLSFSDAARNYTLLTIGDGLVTQIPSLVLSTAAGILVTRVSHAQDMGSQILAQLFKNPKSLAVVAVVLGSMGLIPGMPNLAFLGLASLCGLGVWWLGKRQKVEMASIPPMAVPSETPELSWEDIPPVDPIGLEVGYRLIPLVDKAQGGQLMGRIKGVRKKLSQDWGFLIPPVHIRDNLNLAPIAYRITLFGVTVGEAEVFPEREMAINPGQVFGKVEGTPAQDPAFGLEALWIEPAQREQAQMHGYTVVDTSTVIATHLSQILQNHAHGLLGREEVQKLLENLAKTAPKLVEGLVPEILPLSIVQKVLQQLLEEGVPIRDMRTIVESLTEHGLRSQDPATLTAMIRIALGRFIIQCFNGLEKELQVIAISPALEQLLLASLQTTSEGGGLNMEPGLAEKFHLTLRDSVQRQEAAGRPAILLVQGVLRSWLARFVRHAIPELKVLSYNEIPEDKQVRIAASVGS